LLLLRQADQAQSIAEGITLLTSDPLMAQYLAPVRRI